MTLRLHLRVLFAPHLCAFQATALNPAAADPPEFSAEDLLHRGVELGIRRAVLNARAATVIDLTLGLLLMSHCPSRPTWLVCCSARLLLCSSAALLVCSSARLLVCSMFTI